MWDLDGKDPSHIANYEPFIAEHRVAHHGVRQAGTPAEWRLTHLSQRQPAFGDSPVHHRVARRRGRLHHEPGPAPAVLGVDNFHRLVVHGSTSPLEWLKLSISDDDNGRHTSTNPNSFGPFSWTRMNTGLIGAS